MRILYHHRTRATDAQRVHIREMVGAFRSLGHEVEIASLVDTEAGQGDAAGEAKEAGWKKLARRLPLVSELVQLGYNLAGLPMLVWKMHRWDPDLVYERYSLFNFSGVLAGRLCGKPVMLEVNSPLALEQHQDGDIRAFRTARWSERVIANAATRVFVVSSPLRRMMIENGVEASKLALMPNGVNRDRFRRGEAGELRSSLGLEGKTVIGFVGWFKAWHGVELLLKAFDEAGLAGRGAALLLVGDGPAMPAVRRYVEDRGLGGDVVLTGPAPHERIPAYLDLIDIAVQPAANAYCCPVKILEYMALGKAIVAPRQENIQDLLEDGMTARLFTPGEAGSLGRALRSLADDPAEGKRLGARAAESIERRRLLWTANAEGVLGAVEGTT